MKASRLGCCGPTFRVRLYDLPVWVHDGACWLLGVGAFDKWICRSCHRVCGATLHTFHPENSRGWA
jgi:hypothetical protein